MTARDVVITWPKGRPFQSYLDALVEARLHDEVINYRVPTMPGVDFGAWRERPGRVYVVHDGFVRGYNRWIRTAMRGDNEVREPTTGEYWPRGFYLVRDPYWHRIDPIPMRGFQGWRWFDEREARLAVGQ